MTELRSLWPAPTARRVIGTVRLPGSKSLTNRLLVLGAINAVPLTIYRPLQARDTGLMVDALRAIGIQVDQRDDAWTIHPGPVIPGNVACGLAGTVMRFLPALAAFSAGPVVFDGDEEARKRPMSTLLDALEQFGVRITRAANPAVSLPFTVHGTGEVAGGELTIDASRSSQFVSALLLAAPKMRHGLDLRHDGPAVPSTPHVTMTVELLRAAGITVTEYPDAAGNVPTRWVVEPGTPALGDITVEPDLSNAGPFLAAAMVTGGEVRIPDWPAHTTQPGDSYRELFASMGGTWELTSDNTMILRGPETIAPLDVNMHDVGELVPTVAAVAAFAGGESRLRDIGQLRGHETDRLSALVTELGKVGVLAREEGDDLVISPNGSYQPAEFESYADHRMATFGAILGLRIPGCTVRNVETTSKTLPGFTTMWDELLGGQQ